MSNLSRELRAHAGRRPPHRHAGHRPARALRGRHPEAGAAAATTAGRSSASTSPTHRRRPSACRRRWAARWAARSASPARWGWCATSPPARSPRRCGCWPPRPVCSTRAFNIVLMGMGEPLHNYDATMKALRAAQRARRPGAVAPARHAVHGGPGADDRAAGERAADAEPGHLAPRHHRGAARRDRAAEPEVRPARHHRGLPALPAGQAQPDHLRIRAAERRERHARPTPAGWPVCSTA